MGKASSNDRCRTGLLARFSPYLAGRAGGLLVCTLATTAYVEAAEVTEEMWRELVAANAALRATVESQQLELAELRTRVDQLDRAAAQRERSLADLRDHAVPAPPPPDPRPVRAGGDRLLLSGEAGAAFFAGTADSAFPNEEFRIDEATLRLEAEAARGVYVYGELQLTTRETRDESFQLGELYLEFEDLGGDATPGRWFNLRVGRMDTPFGEEYQRRDLLANPLITHSLSDIWGIDEGVMLFGEAGRADYAVAVQAGSPSRLRDFTADKSVAARVGFRLLPALHLSASAMRTGELDAEEDFTSEIWLGNVVFRSIGSAQTTRFHGELAELDATWSWDGGHLWGAVGRARYGDNDPRADNRRNIDYHQLEWMQHWTPRWHIATRYSRMRVRDGYPLAGLGDGSTYFFGPWTTDVWRLSLGGGYRFNPSVLFKLEYAFERGDLRHGNPRGDTDLFAGEAVVGF